MKEDNTHARVRLCLRGALILLTAAVLLVGLSGTAAAETPVPTATETATVEPTMTQTPEATKTPRPTSTPTATPTPLPAQDLAVSFFNNFCDAGQPLLATIFNTSATPLENQTLRLTLSGEKGVLEEHDHQVSIPAFSTLNLPLFNSASPPWMKLEMRLVTGPADPNPANDSASCGVAAVATEVPAEPAPTSEVAGVANLVPGSSSPSAPPPASGIGGNAVWRQPEPTPTALPQPTVVAPLAAPPSAQPIANGPQPSLTPIGDAGGGLAPQTQGAFPSRSLLMTGVVLLAAGTSWAFYYLTRPPKNA